MDSLNDRFDAAVGTLRGAASSGDERVSEPAPAREPTPLSSPGSEPSEDDEFRYHTPGGRKGVLLIRSMTDDEVLAGAYDDESEPYQRVLTALGPSTNPSWITSQCAEEAYRRGLIDEYQFDGLTA
jgi:hypothetical protein